MITVDKCVSKSLFAGLSISIAGYVYLSLSTSNIILSAILFSVGLLSCVITGSPLFTGKSGFLSNTTDFRRLTLVLILNLFGAYIFGILATFANDSITSAANIIVQNRINTSIFSIMISAIVTGFLMTLAIESESKEHANHLILIFCVAAFILSGSPHCIADMFYYSASSITFNNLLFILPRLLLTILFNFIGCNLYNLFVNKSFIHSANSN